MLDILLAIFVQRGFHKTPFRAQKTLKTICIACPLLLLFFTSSSAQSNYQMEYVIPQKVVIGLTVQGKNEAKIMIASNAPFFITVQGVVGKICVQIALNGTMQGQKFGTNAQLPGHTKTCRTLRNSNKHIIYTANRRTALLPGSPLSQSIVAHIIYTSDVVPIFGVPTLSKMVKPQSEDSVIKI